MVQQSSLGFGVKKEAAGGDDRGRGEAVSPPRDTPQNRDVEGEQRMRDMGGQQPHDRLAELEAENAELRDQVAALLRIHERDREHMRAAHTLLTGGLNHDD